MSDMIKWSGAEIRSMPEGEWRVYLITRLDSIEDRLDECAVCKKDIKGLRWKVQAGYLCFLGVFIALGITFKKAFGI
jgi:hypothetical protein